MYGVSSEASSQEDSASFMMFSKPDNNTNTNTNSSNSLNYRQFMSTTTDLNQSQPSISTSLGRYRSAPTSFLDTLLDTDDSFRKLMSCGHSGTYDTEYDLNDVKEEMVVEKVQSREFSLSGSFSDLLAAENAVKEENEFSPSRSFSDLLAVENGFAKRLTDQIHFSSGKSSSSKYIPQFAENQNDHLENCNSSKGFYVPSFENDSWNESGISSIKRSREDEDKFSEFSSMDNQNKNNTSYPRRLNHHLSLPKTSGEVASMEKYLQFQQEAAPCKIRAKRGFATHPRSIAERMRRTRISDRMKKLQDLFPDMDKQTNTADMLDLAVEYIKNLQSQVQTLTGKKAKCTCI